SHGIKQVEVSLAWSRGAGQEPADGNGGRGSGTNGQPLAGSTGAASPGPFPASGHVCRVCRVPSPAKASTRGPGSVFLELFAGRFNGGACDGLGVLLELAVLGALELGA